MTHHAPTSPCARYHERCLEALAVALERTPMYAGWRDRDPGPGRSVDGMEKFLLANRWSSLGEAAHV